MAFLPVLAKTFLVPDQEPGRNALQSLHLPDESDD
jgi:hypothetical protein